MGGPPCLTPHLSLSTFLFNFHSHTHTPLSSSLSLCLTTYTKLQIRPLLLPSHCFLAFAQSKTAFFPERQGSIQPTIPFTRGESEKMVMMGLERLVVSLKSKISRSLKMKKDYDKMEKSESMRVEIRSRKARKLIEQTLKIADSPNTKSFAF